MVNLVMLFGDICIDVIRKNIGGGSIYVITVVNWVRNVIESLSLDFH